MTDAQAKDSTLVRAAPAKAIRQMRKLLNEMPPGGILCNEYLIKRRVEEVHDELARSLQMDTWDDLWRKGDSRPLPND